MAAHIWSAIKTALLNGLELDAFAFNNSDLTVYLVRTTSVLRTALSTTFASSTLANVNDLGGGNSLQLWSNFAVGSAPLLRNVITGGGVPAGQTGLDVLTNATNPQLTSLRLYNSAGASITLPLIEDDPSNTPQVGGLLIASHGEGGAPPPLLGNGLLIYYSDLTITVAQGGGDLVNIQITQPAQGVLGDV